MGATPTVPSWASARAAERQRRGEFAGRALAEVIEGRWHGYSAAAVPPLVACRSAGCGGTVFSRMSWIMPPTAHPRNRRPQEVTSPHLNEKPNRSAKRCATPLRMTTAAAHTPAVAATRMTPPPSSSPKLVKTKNIPRASVSVSRAASTRQLSARRRPALRLGPDEIRPEKASVGWLIARSRPASIAVGVFENACHRARRRSSAVGLRPLARRAPKALLAHREGNLRCAPELRSTHHGAGVVFDDLVTQSERARLLWVPQPARRCARPGARARLRDVAPTILQLLGEAISADVEGVSMLASAS